MDISENNIYNAISIIVILLSIGSVSYIMYDAYKNK